MKNIKDMTIREMESYYPFQILEEDIYKIVKKPQKSIGTDMKHLKSLEREKRKSYKTRYLKNSNMLKDERTEDIKVSYRSLIDYLIENEKFVDKANLITISLWRYTKAKEFLDDVTNPQRELILDRKEEIEEGLKKEKALAKELLSDGPDVLISRMRRAGNFSVEVISSRELLEEFQTPEERKKERESKKAIHRLPDKALIFTLALALSQNRNADKSCFDYEIGQRVINVIFQNAIKNGIMSEREIEDLHKTDKFISVYKLNKLSQCTKEAFKGIEKYFDMEKMSLNALMEVVESIEAGEDIYICGNVDSESFEIEKYLADYYAIIEGKQVEVQANGNYYTTEDAKNAMKKYINGKYMSDFAMNDQILQILHDKKSVKDVDKQQLKYLRNYITDTRGIMATGELKKMIGKGLMDELNVLKMYENRKLSLGNMEVMKEDLQLEKIVTPEYILDKMDSLDTLPIEESQYERLTIIRFLDLYKELYLHGKSQEDILRAGKTLIRESKNKIVENQEITQKERQENLLQHGLLSEKTYAILTAKGIVETDNFMHMYQKGFITLETIYQLQEEGINFENLDVEQYLMNSYMQIREQQNPDDTELRKWISLYKTIQLKDLSELEKKETADEFVMKIGERIENDIEAGKQKKAFGREDRKRLYELDIIPIDTVVLWGEKDEIIHLLNSQVLVPKDIRRLYQEKRISMQDIQKMIESNIKLEQKISLINIVFPNAEEVGIRNKLFESITELDNTVNSEEVQNNRSGKYKGNENKELKQGWNKYLFDTAVRYNAFIESDEKVIMEIFNDGHIAAHLPDIKKGLVVIEQLYQLKKTQNGKKRMEDAYGAKAFVLTEEAYKQYKNHFITQDNRVIRSELAKTVKALLPNLEEKGINGEIYHFKNYPGKMQETLGLPIYLVKANTDEQEEEALRKLEDSKAYTEEEKAKIMKIHQAWKQVRNSRGLYEER